MNKQSLREIKKEATAHALAEAAFELACERGLDGFVVEDIVQRAGYSRRTFANHFSCKEEAVAMAAIPSSSIEEVHTLLEETPDNATPLVVLRQWMKMQLAEEVIRKLYKLVSLSKQYPTLEPYILSVLYWMQTAAQETLNDLFQDRYPEGYSHILIGAVIGSIQPIFDGSVQVALPGQPAAESMEMMTFEQYLDKVFDYLRNGF